MLVPAFVSRRYASAMTVGDLVRVDVLRVVVVERRDELVVRIGRTVEDARRAVPFSKSSLSTHGRGACVFHLAPGHARAREEHGLAIAADDDDRLAIGAALHRERAAEHRVSAPRAAPPPRPPPRRRTHRSPPRRRIVTPRPRWYRFDGSAVRIGDHGRRCRSTNIVLPSALYATLGEPAAALVDQLGVPGAVRRQPSSCSARSSAADAPAPPRPARASRHHRVRRRVGRCPRGARRTPTAGTRARPHRIPLQVALAGVGRALHWSATTARRGCVIVARALRLRAAAWCCSAVTTFPLRVPQLLHGAEVRHRHAGTRTARSSASRGSSGRRARHRRADHRRRADLPSPPSTSRRSAASWPVV